MTLLAGIVASKRPMEFVAFAVVLFGAGCVAHYVRQRYRRREWNVRNYETVRADGGCSNHYWFSLEEMRALERTTFLDDAGDPGAHWTNRYLLRRTEAGEWQWRLDPIQAQRHLVEIEERRTEAFGSLFADRNEENVRRAAEWHAVPDEFAGPLEVRYQQLIRR